VRSALLPAAALLLLAADDPAPIEVTVSGVRAATGLVRVEVCTAQTFLKACPYVARAPAQKGAVTMVVRGVPPGRYAIQAYHDANNNDDLDRGMFGIPREGLGFSNDAMPRLMKPKFAVASFAHGAQPQRLGVTLRYFLG